MYTAAGRLDLNAQLKQYQPLVRRIAQQFMAKVPASVEVDDLIQAGMIGLADAISRYEPDQGATLETFAAQRIKGSMLDELRANDWMSRGARKAQKDIVLAIQKAEQRLCRPPRESEIAQELGVPLQEYYELLAEAKAMQLINLEDMSRKNEDDDTYLDRHVADSEIDPFNQLKNQKLVRALVDAIKQLPEREQQIMSMYYEEDMNLKEIAAVLNVTESRVSQIHSQSIARLRSKMRLH
jgi:RNA polymerase sigma factor for flagellar operon FliA